MLEHGMTPLQMHLMLDMYSRQLELDELAPTDTHKEQLRVLAEKWGLALLGDRPRLTAKGELFVRQALILPAARSLPARCKRCGADCAFDMDPCRSCGAAADVAPAPLPGDDTDRKPYRFRDVAAPAPLPVEVEELLNVAQELPMGPNDAQDLREFIADITRRLVEAEAEGAKKSAKIDEYRMAANRGELERCFAREARVEYMEDCARVRQWAAEVLASALAETIELAECLFARAEASESHVKAMEDSIEQSKDASAAQVYLVLKHQLMSTEAERDALRAGFGLVLKHPGSACPGEAGLCPENKPEPGCLLTRDVSSCWVKAALAATGVPHA